MTHGITITEDATAAAALVTVATAVIGLVATGPDADAAAFPAGRPVVVASLPRAIAAAGATGTLAGALQAIVDQVKAVTVVVRIGTDPDPAAQDALTLAGIAALLAAESAIGVKPRILGAPGLDSQAATTALVAAAQRLRAFVYARAIGADVTAAQTYRGQFDARELMLIWDDFQPADHTAPALAAAAAVARALGLRARVDQEQGWHKSLSNVPVDGVLGIARPLAFDIMAPDVGVGELNAAQVTGLVRRNGFRFWGNRTCAAPGSGFEFETATRTAQVLADTVAQGLAWAIDRPLAPGLVKTLVERINALFRHLGAEGRVLGARAWFDPEKNEEAALAGGKLVIDYDYTPVSPLDQLGLIQRIADTYETSQFAGTGGGDDVTIVPVSGHAPGSLDLSDPAGLTTGIITGIL